MTGQTRGRIDVRLSKVALVVGFASLAAAVVAAYRSPATGYELSLFAGTPTTYFLGLAVALAVSLVLAFAVRERSTLRTAALALACLSVVSVVALPLLRGYYLYIGGDALTHLGWTRDILAGRLDPANLLYPGLHTASILISQTTGIRLGLSQQYATLAVVLVYVVGITLCVRYLGRRRWAVPIGVFSGLLLLPKNNISTHIEAHPSTLSLLLLPLVLYLMLLYANRDGAPADRLGIVTPTGALLSLAAVAVVFVHPQGALNVVAVLLLVTVTQWVVRRVDTGSAVAGHRSLAGPAVVATVAFLAWTPRFERVSAATDGVVAGLVTGARPADEISQRTTSLLEVGGSIPELFTKLFLPATAFCVLAGVFGLAVLTGRLNDRYPERNGLLVYLPLATLPLLAGFVLFFLASSNTMHFRYLGFVMVPVTVLGALALSDGIARVTDGDGSRGARLALVVVFLLLLPLPVATIHDTPFIYKSTSDVTEMHYDGVNATFEEMDRSVPFAGIRSGPGRLLDGTRGTVGSVESGITGLDDRGAVPYRVFGSNVTEYYEDRRYIPVSEADYQREAVLYDGLRYDAEGFQRLDASPGINRVQTTGEYRLYLLANDTRR